MSLSRILAVLFVLAAGIFLATIAAQTLLPSGQIYAYYVVALVLTAAVVVAMHWIVEAKGSES
jgi:hypothetical protein